MRRRHAGAAGAGGRDRTGPLARRALRGEHATGFDPRTLSIALDDAAARRSAPSSSTPGTSWAGPSMYLRVPDAAGFVFPQAFQCVGLGLGNAIGAAIARPDRLTVAALGDGGALLALPELETLGRLELPLLVVIYDDAAYGAEVHHFRPMGHTVDLAQFPDTDFAALAEARRLPRRHRAQRRRPRRRCGTGSATATARSSLDAKVDPDICAEWLEEAFRGTERTIRSHGHVDRTSPTSCRRPATSRRRPHPAAERAHAGPPAAAAVRQHARPVARRDQPLRRPRARRGRGTR